ncbi:MAG: hypothetical protein KAK00_00375 [Nanoarchaeota archaeon]|nr:hypothetical protein [Nanoarchaeota archaeon]
MRCPDCGSERLEVDETHKVDDHVRRYRLCKDCGFRFRTEEKVWIRYPKRGS